MDGCSSTGSRASSRSTRRTGRGAVALSGKADRIDLLADGTFRLIDYKLGWPPEQGRALQLPIYGFCAEQSLEGSSRAGSWKLGEAAYLAFKGPRRVVPLFTSPDERPKVLAEAQQRLVETVDAIDARRVSADAGRCVAVRDVHAMRGVPEGLRR